MLKSAGMIGKNRLPCLMLYRAASPGMEKRRGTSQHTAFMGLRLFFNGLFQVLYPPVDFLFGVLAGVAILFLEQANEFVVLPAHSLQVVVGELAPPLFGLTLYLLPLTFEYILVHGVISFRSFEKAVRICAGAQDSVDAPDFQSLIQPAVLRTEPGAHRVGHQPEIRGHRVILQQTLSGRIQQSGSVVLRHLGETLLAHCQMVTAPARLW